MAVFGGGGVLHDISQDFNMVYGGLLIWNHPTQKVYPLNRPLTDPIHVSDVQESEAESEVEQEPEVDAIEQPLFEEETPEVVEEEIFEDAPTFG